MNLARYAMACEQFAEEVFTSLTSDDIADLRKECRSLGKRGLGPWHRENQEAIFQLLQDPPSRRARRKLWRDPVQRRRVALFAYWYLRDAALLLHALDPYTWEPGLSYREMAEQAARTAFQIHGSDPERNWPFDPPDPFGD